MARTREGDIGRVLITGAAGAIGACLREGLKTLARELVLTDVRGLEPGPGERFVPADLTDRVALFPAVEGADAVSRGPVRIRRLPGSQEGDFRPRLRARPPRRVRRALPESPAA